MEIGGTFQVLEQMGDDHECSDGHGDQVLGLRNGER